MAGKVWESIAVLNSIIEETKKHIGSVPAKESEQNEDPKHFKALVVEAYTQMYGRPAPDNFVPDNIFWLEATMFQLKAFLAVAEEHPEVVTEEVNFKINNISKDVSKQHAELSAEYPRLSLRIAIIAIRRIARKMIRRVARRVAQKP